MPARIHPFSVALGLVLATICFLAMGQSTVQTPLRVEFVPHPRDYVQIKGGVPYTVPSGKVISLTSVQRIADYPGYGPIQVLVDGQPELLWSNVILPLPFGFTAQPGSILTLLDTSTGSSHPSIRVWGYLANQ